MIIDNTSHVKTSLRNSVEFSVSEDSAKIFSFLSNFLYKDKERSVITELCSNALDAHKMLDKDSTPIRVHLPTEFQKEFRVRDFGPGLTEAQVHEFLTKYGASSKNESNDFIGGFGIGSKSPAAVTDTWTINSFNNGYETSYLIHVNERGIPSINTLYKMPTTDSGLEVVVPTKTVAPWHTAAINVFEVYDVMPELKHASNPINKKEFSKIDGLDLIMFDNNSSDMRYYHRREIDVIMNRRLYKLDTKKIGLDETFEYQCYLPFDTSELSVSLSREDLQYDTKTISKIKSRFEAINGALQSLWKNNVSVCTNVVEYQLAACAFKKKYNLTPSAAYSFAQKMKDEFLTNVDFFNLRLFKFNVPIADSKVQYHDAEKAVTLKAGRYAKGFNSISIAPPISYSKAQYQCQYQCISFVCDDVDKLIFVLRDTTAVLNRVKLELSKHSRMFAVILDKEWYDCVPVGFKKILASTLERPKIERTKKDKVISELFQAAGNHFNKVLEGECSKVDAVYITMSNANTISSIVNEVDAKVFKEFRYDANFVFIKKDTIPPKWAISCTEWIKNKYNSLCAMKDEIIRAKKCKMIDQLYYGSLIDRMIKTPNLFIDIPINSVASQIMSEIHAIKKNKLNLTALAQYDTLYKCAKILNKTIDDDVNTVREYKDRMFLAYPMLEFVSYGGNLNDISSRKVVDYIKLCGM